MPSDDLFEAFEIDPAPIWPADDDRLEPIFFEPDELAPSGALALGEFDAWLHLDPDRCEEAVAEPPPAAPRSASVIGLLGSLGVHLLVLLGLVGGHSAPAETSGAIPVRLVIEPPQAAVDRPQPTPSSSESPSEAAPADRAPAAAAAPRQRPPIAAVMPPPKPHPPPQPPPKPAVAPRPPQDATPDPSLASASFSQPAPTAAASKAAAPGPNASRGDYLDYLVTLTRGHFDLLPLSFLAGRHGRTILSVLVYEDGTISRVSVKHSSGYPDIDARIEQMVTAVGRFPPVPDSFRKPSVELDFNLAFPDALQQQ